MKIKEEFFGKITCCPHTFSCFTLHRKRPSPSQTHEPPTCFMCPCKSQACSWLQVLYYSNAVWKSACTPLKIQRERLPVRYPREETADASLVIPKRKGTQHQQGYSRVSCFTALMAIIYKPLQGFCQLRASWAHLSAFHSSSGLSHGLVEGLSSRDLYTLQGSTGLYGNEHCAIWLNSTPHPYF